MSKPLHSIDTTIQLPNYHPNQALNNFTFQKPHSQQITQTHITIKNTYIDTLFTHFQKQLHFPNSINFRSNPNQ